ncbi:MAG: thioredoxin fold domain-containing protein [Geminicoccaceae bacterium]
MIGMLSRGLFPLLLAVSLIVSAAFEADAAELLMFESDDCVWCAAWDEEIGPIYPKTSEGRRAPLRRVDIHERRPADISHIEGVRFTPTFVLVDDRGQEVGRINGYPGEDFFWGLLSELIAKLPAKIDDPTTST